jgi:starch synthase (maltosyl-transferring)
MWALGLNQDAFEVVDLLDNTSYSWSQQTYVRLDPARPYGKVAHIARVKL